MKKASFIIVTLGLVMAVWGFSASSRVDEEKVLLTILTKILEINHYHDQQINDTFSEKVYNAYINTVDFNKMYFLKSDIEALEKHKYNLDDEILNQNIEFYYQAMSILDKRLKNAEAYSYEILEKPFDFTVKESYEADPDKRDYSATEEELKDYWRKYLKYLTLNTYLGKIEVQEAALEKNPDTDSVKTDAELEKESREQVLKNMKERFRRRAEIDAEDNFSFYVNAVSSSFGPHTQYFPPQQKENFDLRMTGTLEGIGAVLQQEDGYTKISSIVTGSASWRQGELKAGDIILKVAQENEEPVDIVDAPMKEVLKLIRGKKGTEVRLTVQKPDGEIKMIPIVRDVVIREETYAKSALFKDKEANLQYGYINLPSFYSKFGKEDGRNSADDVRDELERLKAQGVSGIVLDLRDNGGGSLHDAVKMAGLFFGKGPVVQVKDKINAPEAKFDYNPAVTYEGPLVVLINEFSASASEIVAGALRDYDRAILVGSSSTYGKGTVQTFIDLNRYIDPRLQLENPFGSLKYTVQQFYRVNGSSTQFKGVHPHVVLPDLSGGSEIGEKELENALPWDSIPPMDYKKWQHMDYSVSEIQEKSKKRTSDNELFAAIEERSEWLKEERENTLVSLEKEETLKKRNERKEKNDAFNELTFTDEHVEVVSLQEFSSEPDSTIEMKRSEWQGQLAKDIYIREAMYILNDMIPRHQFNKIVKEELELEAK